MLRAFAIACVLFGCGGSSTPSEPSGSAAKVVDPDADAIAREQAQFDAVRQPAMIVTALDLKPGARVADIGAGSGLLSVHLARAVAPNGKVVATDIDSSVFDMLKARLGAAKLAQLVEMRLVQKDTPGLEPAAYDAILLSEVDNYFADPVAWLREAKKALKPKGRIVITNRIHRREASLGAAKSAGLVMVSNTTPEPTHFIAVFEAEAAK